MTMPDEIWVWERVSTHHGGTLHELIASPEPIPRPEEESYTRTATIQPLLDEVERALGSCKVADGHGLPDRFDEWLVDNALQRIKEFRK